MSKEERESSSSNNGNIIKQWIVGGIQVPILSNATAL